MSPMNPHRPSLTNRSPTECDGSLPDQKDLETRRQREVIAFGLVKLNSYE
jgi:hypothetical protein